MPLRIKRVTIIPFLILALAAIGCSVGDLVSGAASSSGRWEGKITLEVNGQATRGITRGTDWEKAEDRLEDRGTIEVGPNGTMFDRTYNYTEHDTFHDETDLVIRDVTTDTTITHPAGAAPSKEVQVEMNDDGTYTLTFLMPNARGTWRQKSAAHFVCKRPACLPDESKERTAEVPVDGFPQDTVEGKVDPAKPNVLSGSQTFRGPYQGHREHLGEIEDEQGSEIITITWNLTRQ